MNTKTLFLFFLILLLFNCKSIDYIYYGYKGKNINYIEIFGDQEQMAKNFSKLKIKGFKIKDYNRPIVKKKIRQYQLYSKSLFQRILNTKKDYLDIIEKILKEQNLPSDLICLPFVESGFNPKAYSRAGASGLWQFMYHTGKFYNLEVNDWVDDRRDIYRSTVAAASYLKFLYSRFKDWPLALAAYNAGIGKVSRGLKKYKVKTYWELCKYKYLKKETKDYVPKFLAANLIFKNYKNYGVVVTNTNTFQGLDKITIQDATDLELISKCSEMSIQKINYYNPALKMWCTPANQKFTLRLPTTNISLLKKRLTNIPISQRITFRKYFIEANDNLIRIAKKYKTSVNMIVSINKIKSIHEIYAGKEIFIPLKLLKVKQIQKNKFQKKQNGKYTYTYLHIIQKEDTLYQISKTIGVSLKKIMEWNNMKKAILSKPGTLLILKK